MHVLSSPENLKGFETDVKNFFEKHQKGNFDAFIQWVQAKHLADISKKLDTVIEQTKQR